MQLPIASNYNILIADKRGKMVVVECTPNIKKIGEAKSVDDGYLVCTVNSFISDKLKPYDFAKGDDYHSYAPYMVRDFIKKNADIWKNKKILCIATMGAFSGDGAGCTTRMLKRYGATILGGIHIHMPDSVCDSKLLKKTMDENRCIIAQADRKIEEVALQIINGDYPQEGITLVSHIIGLLGQRLWFYKKTKGYSNKLKINNNCIGCGKCVSICPMKNLILRNKKVVSNDRCTMCYRCISLCPQKAITLLGNEVVEQYRIVWIFLPISISGLIFCMIRSFHFLNISQ